MTGPSDHARTATDAGATPFGPPVDDVAATLQGGVLVLRIVRAAKKNALTAAMFDGLAQLLEQASADTQVAAVIVTGSEGVFTAGADITLFATATPDAMGAPLAFLRALHRLEAPLIAAVDGDAIGVGATLLLHCDFAYAAPTARFVTPFIDLGLCPEGASSLLMPQMIGRGAAKAMLMLGEPLDAEAARAAGLVDAVCAQPLEAALATARRLASKPRSAMRATKRLLKDAQNEAVETVLTREGALFAERIVSPEAQAIFAAFLAKRAATQQEPDA